MDMLEEAERILVTEDAGTAPMYFEGKAMLHQAVPSRGSSNQPYGGGKDISLWRIKA